MRGHDDGPAAEYDEHRTESGTHLPVIPDPVEYDR